VLINNQEEGEFLHSVTANDIQGAELAVEHFIELGHCEIGYIGASNRPKSNRRRQMGYETALKNAGIEPDRNWIAQPANDSDFNRGQAGFEQLSSSGVTAIFCYNDIIAIGLLMACQEKRIRVPEQLSIIGFDDINASQYVSPPLTTVSQSRLQLGKTAMEMTLALLNMDDVQDHTLPCRLIFRKSTAPAKPRKNYSRSS
jgi:LacI family transcriptional regulator/LacI family repressor for deo operon, udp, cdd, tsx, nupC, and nupG